MSDKEQNGDVIRITPENLHQVVFSSEVTSKVQANLVHTGEISGGSSKGSPGYKATHRIQFGGVTASQVVDLLTEHAVRTLQNSFRKDADDWSVEDAMEFRKSLRNKSKELEYSLDNAFRHPNSWETAENLRRQLAILEAKLAEMEAAK